MIKQYIYIPKGWLCVAKCISVMVQSSPEIKAWMTQNGVKSIPELEQYFEAHVLALARAAGRSYIVWQASPDTFPYPTCTST